MGRRIHQYPVVLKSEIFEFLKEVKFKEVDSKNAFNTSFFQQFKDMYNGIPTFARFTCDDVEKFKNCIHWLGLDALRNRPVTDPFPYDYNHYSINPLIFALLNNESLKKVSNNNGDYFTILDDNNQDIDKFQVNSFAEISPYGFDGELTELALEGSVYNKWIYSTLKTKKMADDFVVEITQGRYEDFKIYKTTDPWGGYILGFFVAYFIFDELKGEFWILSKDDYD